MMISRVLLKGFQQFEDTELDLTNPDTGEPARRVCLIGRNGTGKSTILKMLNQVLANGSVPHGRLSAIKFITERASTYRVSLSGKVCFMDGRIDEVPGWPGTLPLETAPEQAVERLRNRYSQYWLADQDKAGDELRLQNNANDLLVYAPAETLTNQALGLDDVPSTNVSNALSRMQTVPFHHEVSSATVVPMWSQLVYLIKKREEEREAFERREENLEKTKRQLIEEFDATHPRVLRELAVLWNAILEPAGLELDEAGASNPVQLNDNLKAYIRVKSNKQRINYSQLSSGIRDFIFRVGHLYLLYFGRRIDRGFVLIDEPENSLFPDFLFELLETYDVIVRNADGSTGTQMFFATHNPIVAAQFATHERIILEWDAFGHVHAKKGRAPEGDDPNDLLEKDFGLTHLMGKEGLRMWHEYLEVRKRIRRSQDPEEKATLLERAAQIGRQYNFDK